MDILIALHSSHRPIFPYMKHVRYSLLSFAIEKANSIASTLMRLSILDSLNDENYNSSRRSRIIESHISNRIHRGH